MQKKIDILTDLINKAGLKPTQRKLAFDLLADIVGKYNVLENSYQKRIKQDHKIKSDFVDYFDRAKTILYLLGISDSNLFIFNYKYTSWITEHINESSKEMSYGSIASICDYLLFYEACYDGELPVNLNELKRFILEPLNISEENYELEYKKAMELYMKTGEKSEILKSGWLKRCQ